MARLLPTLPALIFITATVSCSKPAAEQPKTADTKAAETKSVAAAPRPKVDACALLTVQEIERIQGAAPQQTTPGERTNGNIVMTQCYFSLPSAKDSLVLAIKQPLDPAAGQALRNMWEESFHREKPKRIGRDGKEKQQPSPTKIDGVGDEAFWAGGRFGGTLHVWKGDTSFTLSIGGPADETVMVEKLKELAAIIASRL